MTYNNERNHKKRQGAKAYHQGIQAEALAAEYLQDKGYEVIAQRYKTGYGEVDLIAQDADVYVFVEVKLRSSMQEALESITFRARRRIENAALCYVSDVLGSGDVSMRFDVIALSSADLAHSKDVYPYITHLDNAWVAGT